ncbi:MAG: SAM-dependent methyltransferase [Lachnospiraceae bacterium]|nr:SAM-dependent methyltransferase [Lachnospiraceae bacterium]
MDLFIDKLISEQPYKIILSNKTNKDNEFNKIIITSKIIKGISMYQIEKFTGTQAFHININSTELENVLYQYIPNDYKQLNGFSNNFEFNLKVTKKGKFLTNIKKNTAVELTNNTSAHNKEKNYILKEGTLIQPLIDLGVFTKEGKIVRTMYDKYKQINKFIEIVEDALKDYKSDTIRIIDFGCGKSYLTFIMYYYLVELKHMNVHITGLDLKEKVIDKCNSIAKKYNYKNLTFKLGNINSYKHPTDVDMVVTLHACDTATDYALYNAICWNAKIILSVPCCQHEINNTMKANTATLLTRYGIIKERTAALMTDAIRANLLEYMGYKTSVLEFIDIEHSPKNILLRGVKKGSISDKKKQQLLKEIKVITKEFNINPTLLKLLHL